MKLVLHVNGRDHAIDIDSRTTLLDALRQELDLTGTKKGCDHGQCGACTVIVNGERINSCLSLAVMHDGDLITTIEGLGTPEALSSLQQAFVEHDAYQCGYCTPGQICSATALVDEFARGWPSVVTDDLEASVEIGREEVSERMSGNLCRCGAYPNIVDAVLAVANGARVARTTDGPEPGARRDLTPPGVTVMPDTAGEAGLTPGQRGRAPGTGAASRIAFEDSAKGDSSHGDSST